MFVYQKYGSAHRGLVNNWFLFFKTFITFVLLQIEILRGAKHRPNFWLVNNLIHIVKRGMEFLLHRYFSHQRKQWAAQRVTHNVYRFNIYKSRISITIRNKFRKLGHSRKHMTHHWDVLLVVCHSLKYITNHCDVLLVVFRHIPVFQQMCFTTPIW